MGVLLTNLNNNVLKFKNFIATFLIGKSYLYGLYEPYFDVDYYLEKNDDVADSGLDPLTHFILWGENENRLPAIWFSFSNSLKQGPTQRARPFKHFILSKVVTFPNPLIDDVKRLVINEAGLDNFKNGQYSSKKFYEHCRKWWDPEKYLKLNPDLKNENSLEEHLLKYGLKENRFVGEGLKSYPYKQFVEDFSYLTLVDVIQIGQETFAIVQISPPDEVVHQVFELEQIDPMIFSPGKNRITSLNVFSGVDLRLRDSIEIDGLEKLVRNKPNVLFLVGGLGIGGAEKYTILLANALSRFLKVMILVTESDDISTRKNLDAWSKRMEVFPNVFSFLELSKGSHRKEIVLALLIQKMKPKMVFCINSSLGYEVIRCYGNTLSQITQLFSAFFSQSPNIIGKPFAAKYLESSANFGRILTDNNKFLEEQKTRLSKNQLESALVMPQPVERLSRLEFSKALLKRKNRKSQKIKKLLWLGRWESHKDTELVTKLAQSHPEIAIDVFGPLSQENVVLFPNLLFYPPTLEIRNINLNQYDAFIFTSKYEGMPNSVLEMAGRAIPIISANVGGLLETFPNGELIFYENDSDFDQRFMNFERAINEVFDLHWEAIETMLCSAYSAVERKHDLNLFSENLISAFQLENEVTKYEG